MCALCKPAAAQDAPAQVAEINAFLDRWHHAAAIADEAAYFDAMDSTAVYLGTDPDERWSKQAFHEWAKPHFASGSAWDLTPFGRHVTLAPGADLAWFDEKIKWFDKRLNTWMGTWRGTGVVRRTAAGWRILQYNLTMELPNDRLGDVVHLLRVSRAVDPADRKDILAVTHEYLQARETQNPVRLGKVMAPDARVGLVRGDSIARKGWPFAMRVARDSIPEVTVLGDGTVAVVWAPFSSYEGAKSRGADWRSSSYENTAGVAHRVRSWCISARRAAGPKRSELALIDREIVHHCGTPAEACE